MLKNQAIREIRPSLHPDEAERHGEKVKLAVKPGSVVDSHSSGPRIAARL
jgi:hypothetical protein